MDFAISLKANLFLYLKLIHGDNYANLPDIYLIIYLKTKWFRKAPKHLIVVGKLI